MRTKISQWFWQKHYFYFSRIISQELIIASLFIIKAILNPFSATFQHHFQCIKVHTILDKIRYLNETYSTGLLRKMLPRKKHSSLFCQRVIDEEKKEGFITFKPDLADEWAFDAVNQKCLKAADQLKTQDYFTSWDSAGNTNWRGRFGTLDLLIKVACFVTLVNKVFKFKSSWTKLVKTRSTVLILPLQWGFPGLRKWHFSKVKVPTKIYLCNLDQNRLRTPGT